MVRSCCDPPLLYSWDVEVHEECLMGGVSDDWRVVVRRVDAALRGAPCGSSGSVHRVVPSASGRVVYVDLGEVAQASVAEGGVVWTTR